jgi:hypothetical protein
MKTIISFIKENLALSLVTANLILLSLLILPAGLLRYTSGSFLGVEKGSITAIEFLQGKSKVRLERQSERLPAKKEEGGNHRPEVEYRWKLMLADGRSYPADADRMRDLLSILTTVRSQYSFPLEGDARSVYQLGDDAIRLTIEEGSNRRMLLVGKSSQRSDATYVMREGESEIHELDGNLRERLGSGDELFFRDRAILPPEVDANSITSLVYLQPDHSVRLARAGSEWQMIEPRPGKLRQDMFRPVLDDIVRWKARSFPEAIPADAKKERARIEIMYNRGSTEPGIVQLDIEATGEAGIYYIRYNNTLYTVSSYYLEDLKSPESLLDRTESQRKP